jgi:hypothetical protein
MALVVPNESNVTMLKYILNATKADGTAGDSSGERLLRLFTNSDVNPNKSTSIDDLNEANQSGYAPITLSGASWLIGTTLGVNSAVYEEQVFSFTQAVSVYGYYVTTMEAIPKLLWVERFSTGAFTLPSSGGEIAITPRLNLS